MSPPEGVRAERLVIAVDGKPIATLAAPPWKAPWEAGDGLDSHEIEAELLLSDGSRARAAIRTSPLKVDQFEEVALVNIYAVVRNPRGEYVNGLSRGDFRITENGRPQEIDRFATERKPLRVGIVLDTSLTMKGGKLDAARDAARDFLDVLEPGDEGVLVTFSDAVEVRQDLTGDKAALAAAIGKTEALGGTALYDAIFRTADLLERFEGRRVMVLLSDGRDEAASGLEPGSLHTLDEALDRALRNEVMIFAIGFGRRLDEEMDFYGRESLESILKRLGESTGGGALFSARTGQLRRAFQSVAADLRHQYSLAYVSDDRRHDGSWREIHVSTTRPDLRVAARQGYFAPSDTAPAPRPRRPQRKSGGAGSTRGS